ncbi:MAG: hypothetical protein R3F30_06805, partial [Planctomycetota bacterium]
LLTESQAAGPGGRLELRTGAPGADELTELRTAKADLERRNAELEQRVAELEKGDARRAIEVTQAVPEQPEPPAEVAVAGPAFDDGRWSEGLAEVDWTTMGEAMRDMLPLFDELLDRWEKDGTPPLEIAGRLQQLNGKLIAQLQSLSGSGIPGSDLNGIFTHPLVVSNQVERLLALSDLPLSEQQRARLAALTRSFTNEDEVKRAEAGRDELALAKVLAETGVKDRYYDEMAALLTPEQRARLYNDRTKGRATLDLFSSSLVWLQYARPLPVADFDQLAAKLSTETTRSLGLSGEQQAKVQAIIGEWSRTLPKGMLDWKPDMFDRQGRMQTSRIREAARYQLDLMHRLLRELDLSPEARAELGRSMRVWVPLPTR